MINLPFVCLICLPGQGKEYQDLHLDLDYVGPIHVKEVGTLEKMWVCLFTCLAIQAVHLELVRELIAQQFLECLRKYIARRG